MTDLRTAAQQALEALEMFRRFVYEDNRPQCDDSIDALRAALAGPVPHGCHVDLTRGRKPSACVLDDGRPENCIYAKRLLREGMDKTACTYWKPIEVKK